MLKNFLQALFDNELVGMVEVDAVDRYLHANPRWLKMVGYNAAELRTLNVETLTHPEDLILQQQLDQELKEKKRSSYRMDKRYLHKNGSSFWAEVSVTALYDESGTLTGMIGLIIDISKRRKSEINLAESEKRFRTLIDQMEHIPVQGYNQERQVIYWNRASTELYGYSREEALGRKLEELIIPPPMRTSVIKLIRRYITEGQPIPSGELILQDKNGNDVPVYSSRTLHTTASGAKEIFCIDIDLRLLQQAEGQVRRLAAAIEQTGETIVITDIDGNIEYVNPAFTAITGYSQQEAIGKNARILNRGEQEKSVYTELWATITAGKTWRGRFINKKKDGTRFIESVTISPITDTTGKIINYVASKRDITEQLQTQEQYQQAQKMEAFGQLAGGISHDFNNMLAVIIGQVEIALMEIPPDDPMKRRLQAISTAANRSAELTRQLLGFARKQRYRPEILNLNDSVETILLMLKRLIGEQLELHWHPETELPETKIDPGHLNQILTNLIVNARDAITGSGAITVRTEPYFFDATFCSNHPGSSPGEYVLLEIRDTGCGMDQGTLERIFDPFFTTKGADKGTGLGLSMVFGLVKQNHGYISVDSTLTQGSTFSLYFPTLQSKKGLSDQVKKQPMMHGNETILIVEDEPALLDIATSILTAAGYTILATTDPLEAMTLANEHHGSIQLLLTDVIMPKMNGPELGKQLTKKRSELKILYMSGYPQDNLKQQENHTSGLQLLEKPFSAVTLTRKIREILDRDREGRRISPNLEPAS